MEQLLNLSKQMHEITIFLTIFLLIYLYFTFLLDKRYIALIKKYERYSLVYFFFLGCVFFTGLILFTILKFKWSLKVVFMIMAILHMSITSIKLHKIFKNSRTFIKDSQINFINYAKKKYLIDIFVLVLIGFISFAIHI